MTKTFLHQNFSATFKLFLLFNKDGETLLAATQRMPTIQESAYAYIPAKEDFEKVTADAVVAIISHFTIKTK